MSKTNAFLQWCKLKDYHPAAVPVEQLCHFISTVGNGQVKSYLAAIESLIRHAHNLQPYKGNLDLQTERHVHQKEQSANRKPIPATDWKSVLVGIQAAISEAGGIRKVPTGTLLDALATKLKMEAGFRHTGLARIPWYSPTRIPADAPLEQCTTIFVAAVNTKEVTLRWREGWCEEVRIDQDPDDECELYQATRVGALWGEWERRIQPIRPTGAFQWYGRPVYSVSMWVERHGVNRDGTDRWNLDTRKLPSENTIAARIKRVISSTGQQKLGLHPYHLRHHFASIHKLAKIDHGVSDWEELRRQMRHKDAQTTKNYYLLTEVHGEVRARWDEHTAKGGSWKVGIGRIMCI